MGAKPDQSILWKPCSVSPVANALTFAAITDHSCGGGSVFNFETGTGAPCAITFNLFNHPNFANPGHDINSPATAGFITNTINTPTSILGSGLGGDASRRLVQLKGVFRF